MLRQYLDSVSRWFLPINLKKIGLTNLNVYVYIHIWTNKLLIIINRINTK